uniref:Putative necap endocytosis associated 1 n=1 Tax=Amblyomma triste TaxID=251400 RepID=A0A023GIG1_AMBTT
MEDYESILLVKNEVFVYKIPPRATNRGYRAADWKLDAPEWKGRMRLVTKGKECILKLEDKVSGELFAKCPIDKYPGIAVEAVMDSSRYFVIRLQDDSGRAAFIGIGFADRGDSFDLNVALQDHFKWLEKSEELEKGASDPSQPQLDLSFKEGQTIKISMNIGHKSGSGKNRPRAAMSGSSGGGGIGLLPPPPGGVKLPPPASSQLSSGLRPPPSSPATAQTPESGGGNSTPSPPSVAAGGGAVGNLLDLSPPKEAAPSLLSGDGPAGNGAPAAPAAATSADPWGDFASAPAGSVAISPSWPPASNASSEQAPSQGGLDSVLSHSKHSRQTPSE